MIKRLELENFTAFDELALDFAPGVNLMIGDNGTGKTHVLKILYSVWSAVKELDQIVHKVKRVFLPRDHDIGRLVRQSKERVRASAKIGPQHAPFFELSFPNNEEELGPRWERGTPDVSAYPSVYIPVKEMLANAPGFRSLYSQREIHFEEVYADIIDKAFLPPLKEPVPKEAKELLDTLERIMGGSVTQKGETFYLKGTQGELEFTLLAEGLRKFALLWLLIRNGSLSKGSTLFWDEPEANINPSMIRTLVEILLHLQRHGVQIFIATHSYVVLKEFDLQRTEQDSVRFFALSRDADKRITCQTSDDYTSIVPNKISDAYTALYDSEIERSLGRNAG